MENTQIGLIRISGIPRGALERPGRRVVSFSRDNDITYTYDKRETAPRIGGWAILHPSDCYLPALVSQSYGMEMQMEKAHQERRSLLIKEPPTSLLRIASAHITRVK